MATLRQLVGHLRDCYEADSRETGIADLLHRKIRHTWFFSGSEDLLRGLLPRVPVEYEQGLAAQKEARLYSRDKTLVYAALVIVGRSGASRRLPKRLCAPLVFYPATVTEQDGAAFLEASLDDGCVNLPVLTALAGEVESASSIAETLLGELPEPPWQKAEVHRIAALLMELFPQIDPLQLSKYPELVPGDEVRRAMERGGDRPQPLECLSACAMALVPNSPETRGVLYELSQLSEDKPFSRPLEQLLAGRDAATRFASRHSTPCVPAVLSKAQQGVLESARTNTITLVVGPPGTGKSYTIAALALDHLARGESVLIASRMNHAVDVVARKIEGMIGASHAVVRAGRKQYLRELNAQLRIILQGIKPGPEPEGTSRSLARKLREQDRRIAALERALRQQTAWQLDWGNLTAGAPLGGIFSSVAARMRRGYLEWRLGDRPPLWMLMRRYEAALRERSQLAVRLIRAALGERLDRLLARNRRDLTKFSAAIRSRSDSKQQRLFSEIDLGVLLGAFPIWLAKLADLSEVLPLAPEMFDLAVLDEATQCDVATCLPLLARAKRVVVVGDPNQLRHVSFLSRRRQQSIAAGHELDSDQQGRFEYRENSILDVVEDVISTQDRVLFLNEHFRSLPQIIDFSNREFYAGALHVMRQRPETVRLQCVELRLVPEGRRTSGTNRAEAQALVDDLAQLVEAEAELPPAACQSLGVLSPFRDQVDHISSQLQKRLSLASLERHDVLVGTAHTFQGEERDVMFLSLVADPQSHAATLRFLNNPNVFNVSITRARHRQYVYCSLRPDQLSSDTLLRRYLEAAADPPRAPGRPSNTADVFRRELRDELEQLGFTTWSDYPVAGLTIDLIAQRNGRALGIDLIGYPGQLAEAHPLERYRMFERAGLPLIPLSYRGWQTSKDECLAAIQQGVEGAAS